ncbi:epsin-1 isoform X2 [Zootermopsis nevadensis]|uniref:epsin-1 isoform X2 n=1 Tax=Zootermopsis nevadensis TaxID=136037 RepID=UPI000B8E4980|nr:epsin-1 isoform X2 [Zootermopsis nevadensis]
MRRQKEDMQVNVAGLRRNIKNLAHNYSDAQVKVREATSNDPWGPSSTLMSEIADLTYNVVAFTEIMQMIWKRLNDHGRNWRHVYKALVLLEYLIKTGTEKVAQQCKENIYAIQTLKDFQYFEESKDQGLNVREKAKQLVLLLKDDERLRNERARALKAKERFAQAASGFGSEGTFQGSWSSCEVEPTSRELETARPQTVGEEELQLQLALAMSREEAEQEEQRRRSDDVRLQLALSQSEEEFKHRHPQGKAGAEKQSHMLDLLDVNLGNPSLQPAHAATLDPWGFPQPVPQSPPTRPQNDPWNSPASSVPSASTIASHTPAADPWAPVPSSAIEPTHHNTAAVVDPWRAVSPQSHSQPAVPANDPWSPSTNTDHSSPGTASPRGGLSSPNGDLDEFDVITNRERPTLNNSQVNNVNSLNNNGGAVSPDPFDMSLLGDSLENKQQPQKKTPHSFLGENSALVNLDNLVTVSKPPSVAPSPVPQALSMATVNPFAGVTPSPSPNLFQQQQQQVRPSINQIRQQPFVGSVAQSQGSTESAWGPAPTHRPVLPTPLLPSAQPNPFLS